MPLDHHGRAIADVIPKLVKHNTRGLADYLDSRFMTTRQLKKVSRTDGKSIRTCSETAEEEYYINVCDLWPDERLLVDRVLEESSAGAEIEVKMYDIPKLHNPTEQIAQDLAETLAGLEDTTIF